MQTTQRNRIKQIFEFRKLKTILSLSWARCQKERKIGTNNLVFIWDSSWESLLSSCSWKSLFIDLLWFMTNGCLITVHILFFKETNKILFEKKVIWWCWPFTRIWMLLFEFYIFSSSHLLAIMVVVVFLHNLMIFNIFYS